MPRGSTSRHGVKKSKRGDKNGEENQNQKQKLIGETATALKLRYDSLLIGEDAKGSNAIRIQAKNNKTLNTLSKSLEELEKHVGIFKQVRVTEAVRSGSMKKGVNVLLVFGTVREAFDAISFMEKKDFKVVTVIPKRLRQVYGIADCGTKLNVAAKDVRREIPIADLPPELRQANPSSHNHHQQPKKKTNATSSSTSPSQSHRHPSKSKHVLQAAAKPHHQQQQQHPPWAKTAHGRGGATHQLPQSRPRRGSREGQASGGRGFQGRGEMKPRDPSNRFARQAEPNARFARPAPRGNASPNHHGHRVSPNLQGQRVSTNLRGQRVSPNPRGQRVSPNPRGQRVSPNPRGIQRSSPRFSPQRGPRNSPSYSPRSRHSPGMRPLSLNGPKSPQRAPPTQRRSAGERRFSAQRPPLRPSHSPATRPFPTQSPSIERPMMAKRRSSGGSTTGNYHRPSPPGLYPMSGPLSVNAPSFKPHSSSSSPSLRATREPEIVPLGLDGEEQWSDIVPLRNDTIFAQPPLPQRPRVFPNYFPSTAQSAVAKIYVSSDEEDDDSQETIYRAGYQPEQDRYRDGYVSEYDPFRFSNDGRDFDPLAFFHETYNQPLHWKQRSREHFQSQEDPRLSSSYHKFTEGRGPIMPPQKPPQISPSPPQNRHPIPSARSPPKKEERDMKGLCQVSASWNVVAFTTRYASEIAEKLCENDLRKETEIYYIWKYISHAVGVEIDCEMTKQYTTGEIERKAKRQVEVMKRKIRDDVKLEVLDNAVIAGEDFEQGLKEVVEKLEELFKDNSGEELSFAMLQGVLPDRRAKYNCGEVDAGYSPKLEEPIPVPSSSSALVLPKDLPSVQFVMTECEYCRSHGFKSDDHWEINCFYFLTGCCALCGSESHISPYCPNLPDLDKFTYNQSLFYVRQLIFYYGPRTIQYFPSVYKDIVDNANKIVYWDPILKEWRQQPLLSNDPVLTWKSYNPQSEEEFDLNQMAMGPAFGVKTLDRKAIEAGGVLDSDQLDLNSTRLIPPRVDMTNLKQSDEETEQDEEIEFLERVEGPDGVKYKPSPALKAMRGPGSAALVSAKNCKKMKRLNLSADDHIKLIEGAQVLNPLTQENASLDPLPFPNIAVDQRNKMIRAIQSGAIIPDSLLYPVLPVPQDTIFVNEDIVDAWLPGLTQSIECPPLTIQYTQTQV